MKGSRALGTTAGIGAAIVKVLKLVFGDNNDKYDNCVNSIEDIPEIGDWKKLNVGEKTNFKKGQISLADMNILNDIDKFTNTLSSKDKKIIREKMVSLSGNRIETIIDNKSNDKNTVLAVDYQNQKQR